MGAISDWQRSLETEGPPNPAAGFKEVRRGPVVAAAAPAEPAGPASGLDQFVRSERREVDAQSSPAASAGRAARATIETPLVAAGSAVPDLRDAGNSAIGAVKGAGSAISDFARGFTGSTPAAAPNPKIGGPVDPLSSTTMTGGGSSMAAASGPMGGEGAASPGAQAAAQPAPAIAPVYAANDEPARPSNVRAYLRVPAPPTNPNPGPINTAAEALGMQNDGTWSGMFNARLYGHRADADRNAAIAAQQANTGAYNAETSRISAAAGVPHTAAQTGLIEQQATAARYTLEQNKELKNLTMKLSDPSLSDKERKDLEQQLLILHGKVPRALGKFQVVPGKFNPMTGGYEPSYVIDTATGSISGMPAEAAKADPQAEAKAAVAKGADKAQVNARLKQMGVAELP